MGKGPGFETGLLAGPPDEHDHDRNSDCLRTDTQSA